MPRIKYLDANEIPEKYQHLMNPRNPYLEEGDPRPKLDVEKDSRIKSRNPHRALANNLKIFDAFRRFGAAVWQDTGLSPSERELVIITVARAINSELEWDSHVRIALSVGLSKSDIISVSQGSLSTLDERKQAIVIYTKNYVEGEVNDEIHERFVNQFDTSTLVGVSQLIGYYLSIDKMVQALDIHFEEDFVGWSLENY